MKKAKIFKPSKTPMQSVFGTKNKWVIEYITEDSGINPLMGWESSSDTLAELKLEFQNKESAIKYAKKNKIEYEIIEPKKIKLIIKSYSDNFTK